MTAKTFEIVPPSGTTSRFARTAIIVLIVLVLLVIGGPITVVPAGHVGVKDFFGSVSPNALPPGVHVIVPFTRVHKMSIRTEELKETAEVPSKEGLMMDLEGSVLYRLDPEKAADVYKTVGVNYAEVIVIPQVRSAIREITASYDAKALYSSERDKVAHETLDLVRTMTQGRGVVIDSVLLRKIGLPAIVANAIQEKLKREQEAEQMKFVLQKEQQEAERKRIEAQGIADFQKIVQQSLTPMVLELKGIEATEKLAMSPNTTVVVGGNPKSGLPLILGGGAEK